MTPALVRAIATLGALTLPCVTLAAQAPRDSSAARFSVRAGGYIQARQTYRSDTKPTATPNRGGGRLGRGGRRRREAGEREGTEGRDRAHERSGHGSPQSGRVRLGVVGSGEASQYISEVPDGNSCD